MVELFLIQTTTQNNVAISITNSESSEAFNVHGRGELQLAILIEEMRREGCASFFFATIFLLACTVLTFF